MVCVIVRSLNVISLLLSGESGMGDSEIIERGLICCCSCDFLRDNPDLVCTDTANYLTMWCVNLEVQDVSFSIAFRYFMCVRTYACN